MPRYVLEVGLIELTRVEPLEPIGALLAKLEALESRVEKGVLSSPPGGGGSGGGTRAAVAPAAAVSRPQPTVQAVAPKAAPVVVEPARDFGPPDADYGAPDVADFAPPPPPVAARPAPPAKQKAPANFTELLEAIINIDPFCSDIAQSRLLARDSVHLSLGFDSDFAANRLRERLPQLRAAIKTDDRAKISPSRSSSAPPKACRRRRPRR